jgi:hypothetical protein
MPEFRLQFPASAIEGLASRYSYQDDRNALAAGAAARRRGHFERGEFLTVCSWKTGRSRSRVETNDDAAVEQATRAALLTSDEGKRMDALLTLNGVGIPTGSALLFAAYPDRYSILDVRALESLGQRGRTAYPISYWCSYLAACRKLAKEHSASLRTLDKALWQHSVERGA